MNDKTGAVKQIPYGMADYGLIQRENYYYVDKTMYLPAIEKAGRYLFFIRPRRDGAIRHTTEKLLNIMTEWYGNFRFSENDDVCVFNAGMVLYYISVYLNNRELPKKLIDSNVRMDYEKLRHTIVINKELTRKTSENFNRLKQIMETKMISSNIVKRIPIEQFKEPQNFVSLLFYYGLLTIKGTDRDKLLLAIPNGTANSFYFGETSV